MADTLQEKLLHRWGALKNERSSFIQHWTEISQLIQPRSGRFFIQDRNRGDKKHNHIYDSTGTKALRTLGAGMMAGATSPARPWFALQTADPDLNKFQPVKIWLHDVTNMMRAIFKKSNTYRALHSVYEELGTFGTASSIVMPNFDRVIHHHPLTAGEYAIATDYEGRVITLYREFEKTVGELVREFGYKNCSQGVRNSYDQGALDRWITVVHAVEPREDRDVTKRDSKNMPFRSVHFEQGAEKGKFLRESGFKSFPALCPRWITSGGDIYGSSPGMEALGDLKQLQHQQRIKGKAISYQGDPPIQVPTTLKESGDFLPGGVSFYDAQAPGAGIRSAYEVPLNLQYLREDIMDVRQRINSTFFADLFLMLSNATDTRMTATEVAERHEEKLLMLGPVLERLHNELLDPMIEMTFERMVEANILPPPPPELQGMDLNVEFVSMLAQAQRAVGTNAVDRFVGNLGAVAQFKPEVLDKFDPDSWADSYADMLGIDPNMIIANDKVAIIRQQKAQAAQQQAQAAMAQQQADTMQKLGSVDTGGKNAATDIMGMFSGYNSPGPTGL